MVRPQESADSSPDPDDDRNIAFTAFREESGGGFATAAPVDDGGEERLLTDGDGGDRNIMLALRRLGCFVKDSNNDNCGGLSEF